MTAENMIGLRHVPEGWAFDLDHNVFGGLVKVLISHQGYIRALHRNGRMIEMEPGTFRAIGIPAISDAAILEARSEYADNVERVYGPHPEYSLENISEAFQAGVQWVMTTILQKYTADPSRENPTTSSPPSDTSST